MNDLLDAAKRGVLTEAQADALPLLGAEAVALFALSMAQFVAQLQASGPASVAPSPSTPSAMVPVYQKPATPRRRKKPGARDGHPGARRRTPERIDVRQEHRLEVCPCCAGPLQRCKRTRTRIIEDIPKAIEPVVTEHTLHRDKTPVELFCVFCSKMQLSNKLLTDWHRMAHAK